MGWEAWAALALIAAVLYALANSLAGSDVVLTGAVIVVVTLGLASERFPSADTAVRILANEGLLTVGILFVVAAGLTDTGALHLLTERFLGTPKSIRAAQFRLLSSVMTASAFLNNTPVVAMFMPLVSDWCKRARLSPSKLFIPLSYAAVLGGVCTLIGTSTNLLVLGLMQEARRTDPSMPTLGMFTITPVGFPVAVAGALFILAFSARLLPDRRKAGDTNIDQAREYTVDMAVQPGSAIDGKSIEQAGLRHLPGVFVAAIERNGLRRVPVPPDEVLRGGDRLTCVGGVDSVLDLQRIRGLESAAGQASKLSAPPHARILAEAVVSPACPLVGKSIRDGRFRHHYEAVVIGVHRDGARLDQRIGDIVLEPGDTLVLETSRRFIRQQRNSRDFFLVSGVADSTPPRHDRAWLALLIMGGMVVAMATEQYTGVGTFHAALLAAGLMGLTGCLSAAQARRSVDWETLVTIAGALVLGRAVEMSGLATAAADAIVGTLRPLGPVAVLAGVYLLTLICTEIVTNNAAAALAFPLAHAAAQEMGVSFMPFAIAIAVAASAGFATPLGYQTHLMVYGPGGYRFADYLRIGIPLDLLAMVVAITAIVLFIPF